MVLTPEKYLLKELALSSDLVNILLPLIGMLYIAAKKVLSNVCPKDQNMTHQFSLGPILTITFGSKADYEWPIWSHDAKCSPTFCQDLTSSAKECQTALTI